MAGLQADRDIIAGLAEAKRDEFELEKKGLAPSEASHDLDGVHDGLEFPTEDEKATLRRVSDSLPWSAYREYSRVPSSLPHTPSDPRASCPPPDSR